MADVDLALLGRLLERALDDLRDVKERLGRIERTMATRELVTRAWRQTDERMSNLADATVDAALAATREELDARLADHERRLRALEERG